MPLSHLPESHRSFGLRQRPPRTLFKTGFDYAHVDGWKTQCVIIDRTATDDLALYDLGTDGPGTMIVNGYVVSAFASDKDFDFTKVRGNGL